MTDIRRYVTVLTTIGVVFLGLAATAHADEGDEGDPAPPVDAPADAPAPAPPPAAPSGGAATPALPELLGPIDVIAPRIYGGPAGAAGEIEQTTLRRAEIMFDVPASVTTLLQDDIRMRRQARSMSDALEGLTSVMVQKTGPLQHSPYIRGFTGYQNLLLIDGIRLNNSSFRAGPNQYWATVDPLSIERLELTRGPHSVLYGSDAVGGTVNVLPWRRTSFERGLHVNGGIYTRGGTADGAYAFRGETEGNKDGFGWAVGANYKTYHDIYSGDGLLRNTGGIDEFDADMRYDWRLGRGFWLAFGWQHVRQYNAPRTEQTIYSKPFKGTSVGSELQRDLDQSRDLVYARLGFDGGRCCWLQSGQFTVSWHRQSEERDRKRTGDRRDLSGFTVTQLGVGLQMESSTGFGNLVYGFDWYRDYVDSFRRDYQGGVYQGPSVQGPLGDDATYDLLGVYIEDQITFGCFEVIPGIRFTYARAEADRVDNPEVAGSDPNTPGNVISVDNDWTNVVGSVRAIYHVHPWWNVYGSVSQAFRAPSLYDLTSFDATSVIETPAPDLDAENFVSFELGVKRESRCWRMNSAVWYTLLDDTIVRSPTGDVIDGTPEVRKDNIGDGWIWGVELEAAYSWNTCWTVFGNVSWAEGKVDQLDQDDNLVRTWVSRNKPLTSLLGIRYERGRFWAQAEWLHSESEGRLSFRDEGDSRRIPPGGTPGWDEFALRAGYRVGRDSNVSIALENLLDQDYRVHGSGQNAPGFNAVLAIEARF